jgi:hypothetical protein
LRKSKGKNFDDFGTLLNNALDKIANFEGLLYRKVYLTRSELKRYQNAVTGKNIKEYTFVSTTKSRLTATNFVGDSNYTPNCLFRLQVKTGKDIEKIARFEELEVLLKPNALFAVLEVKKESDYHLITMEEI